MRQSLVKKVPVERRGCSGLTQSNVKANNKKLEDIEVRQMRAMFEAHIEMKNNEIRDL